MKKLIQAHLPHIEEMQIEAVHSGWDHYIYIVNQRYIIRIAKSKNILAKLKSEMILLNKLSQLQTNIDIPKYSPFYNTKGELIGAYYPFIAGQSLSTLRIVPSLIDARRIGEFLSHLHRIDVHQAKKAGIKEIHSKLYWEQLHHSLKQSIFSFLQAEEIRLIERLFIVVAHFKADKVVIHGDLTSANILYDPLKQSISGIIDFTDTQLADPSFDFAGLYWDFGALFAKEALASYDTSFSKEDMYNKISSFYGVQPIFHEWLKMVNDEVDEEQMKQAINTGIAKIKLIQNR